MPSISTYDEILNSIHTLSPEEQVRLLEELAARVRAQGGAQKRRTLLELQGLGKEVWKGIDVQEYLDRERLSWNG